MPFETQSGVRPRTVEKIGDSLLLPFDGIINLSIILSLAGYRDG